MEPSNTDYSDGQTNKSSNVTQKYFTKEFYKLCFLVLLPFPFPHQIINITPLTMINFYYIYFFPDNLHHWHYPKK